MTKWTCKVGGAVGDVGELRFGFNAPAYCYANIGDELGISKLAASGNGNVSFGGRPKPPRVRISYSIAVAGTAAGGTDNDVDKSVIRFCDPDKLGQVLGGSLRGKKLKDRTGADRTITTVTTA